MKTYVVSLQKDVERRNALKSHFSSFDEFEIISGIYGKELEVSKYYDFILETLKKYKILLSPAEVGTALSHMKVYEHFLASEDDFALVLEDDVIGNDECLKKAENIALKAFNICPNYDFIAILGAQNGLDSLSRAFGKKIEENFYEISKYSYVSITRAAAYIITRNSASKILDSQKQCIIQADNWNIFLNKNNLKMFYSDIFAHPQELTAQSNIEDSRAIKLDLFPKKRPSFLWKIKRGINKRFFSEMIIKK